MSWRAKFLIHFGPGVFSGITLGHWLRILRENRFAIDPPYWGRAAAITSASVPNTVLAWWEDRVFGRKVREAKVEPPLFVLGIWRSGTTLLHNLLARDDRFAYPNNYQVCYPRTFLTTESVNARFVDFFVPATRPQDNMTMGMGEPQEDEFAFASLTTRSFTMAWTFPRRAEHYDRYLTLRGATAAEVAEWKSALLLLVRKLSFKYGRPLVLKSPGHTGRIRLLLELFPDARFVHIHRNPYVVFQSTHHMYGAVVPWVTLQRPDRDAQEARMLRQYNELYDAFFEERALIPPGRLHEVGFEDLEADPVGQLRRLYEALALPDFAHVEPALRQYVDSLSGYRKNSYEPLPPALRERVAREWRRCFDEWGYPT
jgi:hypothetical protein